MPSGQSRKHTSPQVAKSNTAATYAATELQPPPRTDIYSSLNFHRLQNIVCKVTTNLRNLYAHPPQNFLLYNSPHHLPFYFFLAMKYNNISIYLGYCSACSKKSALFSTSFLVIWFCPNAFPIDSLTTVPVLLRQDLFLSAEVSLGMHLVNYVLLVSVTLGEDVGRFHQLKQRPKFQWQPFPLNGG